MRLLKPILPVLAHDGDGDGGDEKYVTVQVSVREDDGSLHEATAEVNEDDSDTVAAALVACLRGVAAARGSDQQVALAKRLGEAL